MTEIERAINSCQNKMGQYKARLNGADFHRGSTMNAIRLEKVKIDALRKVDKYDKAQSEGLLVVLPCNTGRTVYIVDNGKIHRCVTENTLVKNGLMARVMEANTDTRYVVYPEDIGKTVFLTRAEAEAAVSGGERNE